MKTNLLLLITLFACTNPPPNPILQLETKLEKETPYHFNYEHIPIDCTQRDSLFALLFQRDQKVRNQGGDMLAVDEHNFDLLISYFEQCGWPRFTTKFDSISTLHEFQIRSAPFFVLQHSFKEAMANYYFDLKTSANEGEIKPSNFALYQDRLLLYFDLPQVYGTQIKHSKERIYLYRLWSPERVNERRKAVKLIPIEDYLARYGLNFEQELKQQKNR